VEAFLAGSLRFGELPDLLARAIDEFEDDREPELDDIPALDADVRSAAASWTGMTL
jgi:1-deoxy-D-xylulose 5-phosphate reductoisomerase